MKRKDKVRKPRPDAPSSSHPEAEAGVRIFAPGVRRALRQAQPLPPADSIKPIISINGRDVDDIPNLPKRAA